jgi:uncharacterized protein YkwD
MRFVSGFGGILAIVALALSAGVMTVAHHQAKGQNAFTAARHQVAEASSYPMLDPGDPAPQRMIPRPSPDPSPTPPATAAPAAPPAPVNTAPQPPAIVVNSTQQALINRDRAGSGLGSLTWSNCLYNIAVSNARRIAAQGYLSHTSGASQDLACGLGRQGGENIGYWSGGINDPQLNTMFMNSSEHRANILGPYHYVATAWVVAGNGTAYVAVEFA